MSEADHICGVSAVGKTSAWLRSQTIQTLRAAVHSSTPKLAAEHRQVVWLAVEVAPSGLLVDFSRALMLAWEQVMKAAAPRGSGSTRGGGHA